MAAHNVQAINNPNSLHMAVHAPYPTGIKGLIKSIEQKTVQYGQAPGLGIPGFATLPWHNDAVVYCDITAAVPAITMIVTGPLTGCHLTAFQVPAGLPNANHVYFMHTNANALPGLATSNPMRDHVMTAVLGMPAGTPHSDCRIHHEYHNQAFAMARVTAGGHVDFYVHDVPPGGGRSTTTRWAHF